MNYFSKPFYIVRLAKGVQPTATDHYRSASDGSIMTVVALNSVSELSSQEIDAVQGGTFASDVGYIVGQWFGQNEKAMAKSISDGSGGNTAYYFVAD
jgi:hypothetical protein